MIWVFFAILAIALVALNVWYYRHNKQEKLRRSLLTPEQMAEEDDDQWCRDQF